MRAFSTKNLLWSLFGVLAFWSSLLPGQTNRTGPVLQQPQTPIVFNLHGRVSCDCTNQIPELLEVRLLRNQALINQTFVRSDRSFEFNQLPPGTFTISIHHEKYQDINLNVELFGQVPQTFYVDVLLTPKSAELTNAQRMQEDDEIEDAVSVAQLSAKVPHKAMKFYQKSLELSRKGKLAEAVVQLQHAIELAPDFYSAQRNLGELNYRLDQPGEAIPPLKAAGKLNPNSATVNYFLGLSYLREKDFPTSLNYFDKVIFLAPDKASPYYFKGYLHYKLNQFPQAEKSLKKAITLNPLVGSYSRLQLANIYLKESQLVQAYKQMEDFLKEQPTAQEVSQVMSNLQIMKEIMGQTPDHH